MVVFALQSPGCFSPMEYMYTWFPISTVFPATRDRGQTSVFLHAAYAYIVWEWALDVICAPQHRRVCVCSRATCRERAPPSPIYLFHAVTQAVFYCTSKKKSPVKGEIKWVPATVTWMLLVRFQLLRTFLILSQVSCAYGLPGSVSISTSLAWFLCSVYAHSSALPDHLMYLSTSCC